MFQYGEKGQASTVNVVKFSPLGTYMASAGVSEIISLWDRKMRNLEFGKSDMAVKWGTFKQLRGHFSEVTDVYWSRDEKYLVSGSVDNSCILWSIEKESQLQR